MGLSQADVAKGIGITFQQVQKYEKGINSLNSSRLYNLGEFLNVPVYYFFEQLEADNTNSMPALISVPGDSFSSDREFLEMMKALNKITDTALRKKLAELLRALSSKDNL